MIGYGKHTLESSDIEAVNQVLLHQQLTQGEQVPAFEQALCEYTGAKYAVAVNSATSGLHIACLAAGLGQGDLVYTCANTFVASANCALYCGASIDFVDIDAVSRQFCLDALEQKLVQAKASNHLPKAVIVVHFAGHACDMQRLASLSKQYGFIVIEDNAHGLGGQYQGQYRLGKPVHSQMTVCSFHPVKTITSCEGGAVLTDSAELANKLRMLSSHGITKDADYFVSDTQGIGHFEQHYLGYNYRLSDVHAALGRNQLIRIDDFVQRRLALAKNYSTALSDLPLILPDLDIYSAWHLYVVELLEHDQKQLCAQLKQQGIAVTVHYIPVHWHPFYQQLGFHKGQFPNSETYYKRAMSLPLFPTLSDAQQAHVIAVLKELLL